MMEQSLLDLKILFYSTSKVVKQTLAKASDQLVHAIAELALNVVYNEKLNVNDIEKTKLNKYRRALTILANRQETLARKRHLIKTKGYLFVPLLLQNTLPYVARNGIGASGGMETTEGRTGNAASTDTGTPAISSHRNRTRKRKANQE
jgi:hypothetical protein